MDLWPIRSKDRFAQSVEADGSDTEDVRFFSPDLHLGRPLHIWIVGFGGMIVDVLITLGIRP